MKNHLNIFNISDLHFGNNRNPTKRIITNIKKMLVKENKIMSDLDVLAITGDIFDQILTLAEPDGKDSMVFLFWLYRFCKDRDIALRILEGTGSHDNNQAEIFSNAFELFNTGLDFKYVKSIYIETFKGFDILYVPDEVNEDASKTFTQVKQLLKKKNIVSVDIGLMHGHFDFHIPQIVNETCHSQGDYERIVKHIIFIGHDHKHNINGKIVTPGSFDRLTHGQEEPKGGVYASVFKTGKPRVYFLENKSALVFNTYLLENLNFQDKLKTMLTNIPKGSYVRLSFTEPYTGSLHAIRKVFPGYIFTIDKKRRPLNLTNKLIEKTKYSQPVSLDKASIRTGVTERLQGLVNDAKLLGEITEVLLKEN